MVATSRLANSSHPRLPRSMDQGAVDSDREIEVTVLLRENPQGPALDDVTARLNSLPLEQRNYYSREQFARIHGSSAEDRRAVRQFAARNNLQVVETSVGARTMRIRGRVEDINEAFGVQLREYAVNDHGNVVKFHAHSNDIQLDPRLMLDSKGEQRIHGVFGLDSRPIAQPRYKRLAAQPRAGAVSYDPPQVAKAYNYPQIDGTGVTIGIIELGGTVSDADITNYFKRLGLPKPTVKHVSVDGAKAVSDPQGADVEVALDVQVIGAMAPGCTIIIYDAPNTEQGFIDAIAAASNDSVNKPVAVSISWGAPENGWTSMGMDGMNKAAQAGSAMGVTFTAAAGDNGNTDGVRDGKSHADHPSSAPYILACGGTNLQLNADGSIRAERVWGGLGARGATGGGVSDHFATPDYQTNNGINPVSLNADKRKGRGDPDVGGVADPASSYNILSNGVAMAVGGTSAVAPQWAALVALISKQLGKGLGFVQPALYAVDRGAFQDVTVGNNGDGNNRGYPAQVGYDLCTGLGTPNGERLLQELTATLPAPAPGQPCKHTRGGKKRAPIIVVNEGGTVNIYERGSDLSGPAAA